MTYRKRTLRSMPPTTRRLARLIGEIESVARRAKNLLEEIQTQERESQALRTMENMAEDWQEETQKRHLAAGDTLTAALAEQGEQRRELGRESMERQS